MTTLSLNPVVDVVVEISPLSAPRRAFDLGLIIGDEDTIPVTERVRQYTSTDDMLTDGFTTTDSTYKAALIYFSQSPKPYKVLIGRQSLTGITAVTIGAAGTGYSPGEVLTLAGGTGGAVAVTTVSDVGAVTGISLTEAGSGYAVGTGTATTASPVGGTGCTIDITAIGETPVDAVRACRGKNNDWYIAICPGATKAEHLAIAAYVEAATPTTRYFYTTDDASCLTTAATSLFAQMKAHKYNRSHGVYSASQKYVAVSVAAYAMRANTGLANSAYTLKFKDLPGITVENLTTTQVTNLEAVNGNVYINRGYYYDMYEQGVMADGTFFDEGLGLDMLSNSIQLNVMDALYQSRKVPQTEAGVTQLVNSCNQACISAVSQGFLAPGKWTGQDVLELKTGDLLPLGYMVQSEAINDQDQADREARKAPPIYVSIKEAGAIHSVTIGVYVSR